MSGWPNTVAVGDFVADVDAPGGDFRVTAKITGWGSAPVRLTAEDKSQQDGGWDSQPARSARPITIEGVVDQPDHASAQAIADTLCALSLRQLHEFVVDNEAIGPRSALVRIAASVEPEWETEEFFTYVLQLWAPDPLKYGPPTVASTTLAAASAGTGLLWPLSWPLDWGVPAGVTPGAVTAANAGTATYWPTLRIYGPVTNPVVRAQETGDSLTFNATIPAGQWVDIDAGARHVTFGANEDDVRYLTDVVGRWLAVPPGGVTYTYEGDGADAAAVLYLYGREGAWD